MNNDNTPPRSILIPFCLAGAILLVLAGIIGFRAYHENEGHFVYALDDSYIHMSIAKNVSTAGVFGITRHEFSSASSSPLWTLLLAATFKVMGVREWIPAFWCVFFALLSLYATSSLCRVFRTGMATAVLACFLTLFLTPLLPLIFTGMEHTLHIALTLLLIKASVDMMESPTRSSILKGCMLCLLAVATRYETLFLIVPLVAVLAYHKRWLPGILMLVAGTVPVIAFGAFSAWNGSYWLPNSLMVKGHFHPISGLRSLVEFFGYFGFRRLIDNERHLFSLCVLVLIPGILRHATRKPGLWLSLSFCCATLIHLQLANSGWFFRYEAYLVAFGSVLACVLMSTLIKRTRHVEYGLSCLALLAALAFPLCTRAALSLSHIVPATNNIYTQQYQMGQFLAGQSNIGAKVAVNDIGAVSFFGDLEILDLEGLGSVEVIKARKTGRYDAAVKSGFFATHRTEYVIAYASSNLLPQSLIQVGTWTITNNLVCAGDTVSFFGTTEDNAARLSAAFIEFTPKLPHSVRVDLSASPNQGLPRTADSGTAGQPIGI